MVRNLALILPRLKRITSILLILAFLAQASSQLWILAAFTINRDFIAANLCINRFDAIPLCKGSCYLESQLNKDQQQQQKTPELKTGEISLFFQDNSAQLPQRKLIPADRILYPEFRDAIISAGNERSVFHPPSVLA